MDDIFYNENEIDNKRFVDRLGDGDLIKDEYFDFYSVELKTLVDGFYTFVEYNDILHGYTEYDNDDSPSEYQSWVDQNMIYRIMKENCNN